MGELHNYDNYNCIYSCFYLRSIAGPVYEVVGEGEAFGALADQTATTRTETETDVMRMEPNPVYGINEIALEPNPVYGINEIVLEPNPVYGINEIVLEPNPVYGINEIPLEPNPVYGMQATNTQHCDTTGLVRCMGKIYEGTMYIIVYTIITCTMLFNPVSLVLLIQHVLTQRRGWVVELA